MLELLRVSEQLPGRAEEGLSSPCRAQLSLAAFSTPPGPWRQGCPRTLLLFPFAPRRSVAWGGGSLCRGPADGTTAADCQEQAPGASQVRGRAPVGAALRLC